MGSRPRQKLVLQSINNIRGIRCTDFVDKQPNYQFALPKNHNYGKTKRYSSSVDEFDEKECGTELNGWDEPSEAMDGCTNILHGLSSKLQDYEMQQRRQDEEHLLDEIKENYKNIMERAKETHRPSEVFLKYREEITLYNENNESRLDQISQKKEPDAQKRPKSNQAISARPAAEAPSNYYLREKTNGNTYNFTRKNIEKHKSEKALADFPQTTGLLLMRNRMSRVERVKKWLQTHDKREKTTIKSRQAKEMTPPYSNLVRAKELRKEEMPFIERRQRLKPKRLKLNITEERQPTQRSQFQDTKLFGLR